MSLAATAGEENREERNRRSLTGARWVLRPTDEARVLKLQSRLGVSYPLARCLSLRGIVDPDEARSFLHPDESALHDPFEMFGMATAVERLTRAVKNNEHIRVVTDYDVDGTTSSVILQAALKILGNDHVSYHIPHRMEEGYGFSVAAAEQAAADGATLVITADIGVKDHASVSRARAVGVDVLVLDHHLPPGEDVPSDAVAVLCPPQRLCSYPNRALAACGVSLKLAQALLRGHAAYDAILRSMLKMAAIGTVADVVNLLEPENRAIVSLGLRALNEDRHKPGLAALLRVSGVELGAITASDLGFRIGPRINAAGRVSSATAVIELLAAGNHAAAMQRAQALDAFNSERKGIQERMLTLALAQVPEPVPAFVVVSGREDQGWHRGVAGIVAARIRDKLNRPTAVISEASKGATGSIRSIPQVHAVEALEAAAPLLQRFGGHPAAAGFSLEASDIPAFRSLLVDAANEMLGGKPPILEQAYDLESEASILDRSLCNELDVLGPHGKGNPKPRIKIAGAELTGLRVLKEKHLKAVLLLDDGVSVDVVWWGGAEHFAPLARGRVDLLGVLEVNRWRGRETLQLNLTDARLA